jgi:DNA-binding HxlR family transcriptional regulator
MKGLQKMAKTDKPVPASRMVEDVIGCKWSFAVLGMVSRGVCRPGSIRRSIAGLTAKVLNERLRKLTSYGILERRAYPEIPPRVEYRLTGFGRKFTRILRSIEKLQETRGTEGNPR